jgi:hypothetical protein
MLNARLLVILRCATARLVTPEIRLVNVLLFGKIIRLKFPLHALQVLVVLTLFVENKMALVLALVSAIIMAILTKAVDPNAFWTLIVHQILLASAINAKTLAQEHAAWTPFAKL